jgi:tRNA G26 N,N-dimethylase Trm1
MKIRSAIHLSFVSTLSLCSIGAMLMLASPVWAEPINDANVAQHIADAKTPAEQQEIADYFRARAAQEGERVQYHEKMLASYTKMSSGQVGKPYQQMVDHCKALIGLAKQSQSMYLEMAQTHSDLAKSGPS